MGSPDLRNPDAQGDPEPARVNAEDAKGTRPTRHPSLKSRSVLPIRRLRGWGCREVLSRDVESHVRNR
jgi:hypothetical protein